jgi:hypothetical protein
MITPIEVKEVQEVEEVQDRSLQTGPGSLCRFLSSRRRFLGKNNSNLGGSFGEVLGQ